MVTTPDETIKYRGVLRFLAFWAILLMLLMNWHQLPFYAPSDKDLFYNEYMPLNLSDKSRKNQPCNINIPYGTWSNGYYFISEKCLRKRFLGKTFKETNGLYRLADYYSSLYSDSVICYYNHIAMLDEKGAFYTVQVTFDDKGKCNDIKKFRYIKKNNQGWIMQQRSLQTILSWDWLTWFVQESPYGVDAPKNWLIKIPYYIAWWLLIILWTALPLVLPAAIYYNLIPMDKFHRIPSFFIYITPIFLTLIWAYIWMAAMIVWGAYSWVVIPTVCITVIFLCIICVSSTIESRCPKCGHVGTYKVVNSTLEKYNYERCKERNEIGIDHKETIRRYYVTKVDRHTETEYIRGGGVLGWTHTDTTKRIHHIVEDIYARYSCYDVRYRIPIYRDYYDCSACHHKDLKMRTAKREEESRRRLPDEVFCKKRADRITNTEIIDEKKWIQYKRYGHY